MKLYERNWYSRFNYDLFEKVCDIIEDKGENPAETDQKNQDSLDDKHGYEAEKLMVMLALVSIVFISIGFMGMYLVVILLSLAIGIFLIPLKVYSFVMIIIMSSATLYGFKYTNLYLYAARQQKKGIPYARTYAYSKEVSNADVLVPIVTALLFFPPFFLWGL